MKNNAVLAMVLVLLLVGCTNTPKPIAYGADTCNYCSMTIVDKQHAAQFMTKKGRSYTFDASECMLNYLKEVEADNVELYLVNDYNAPGQVIDATKATFLISENIPSPMGAFLTAFATEDAAQHAQAENQGKLHTWDELLKQFKK